MNGSSEVIETQVNGRDISSRRDSVESPLRGKGVSPPLRGIPSPWGAGFHKTLFVVTGAPPGDYSRGYESYVKGVTGTTGGGPYEE